MSLFSTLLLRKLLIFCPNAKHLTKVYASSGTGDFHNKRG